MDERSAPCKALVLAGGGARGSYQVGVWRALMELDWHPQIITGTSVGSLNGAMFVLDQYETARDMWLAIRSKDVMELPEEDADLSALHQFLRSVVKAGGMDVTRWKRSWSGCWTRMPCARLPSASALSRWSSGA